MAQVVSRRPITAEARVRSQTHVRFVVDSGTGTGTRCYLPGKDNRAKPGHLPKSDVLLRIGQHWIKK
jgi:hypothetical protein